MARRSCGEGTYTQIKPGRWQGRLRYTDPITGKGARATRYGKTPKEANARIDEVRQRLNAGLPATDTAQTLGVWAARWCEAVLPASGLRESTQGSYRSVVKNRVLSSPIAGIKLSKLRPSDFDGWIVEMRRGGSNRGSIDRQACLQRDVETLGRGGA